MRVSRMKTGQMVMVRILKQGVEILPRSSEALASEF